jgi:hypothetical protein
VSVLPLLASTDRWYWVKASFIAAASAVVIAVPTWLTPNVRARG